MCEKIARSSGKFPGNLESFQVAWKVSKLPGKFPGDLKSFQVDMKVSRWHGKFPWWPGKCIGIKSSEGMTEDMV